MGQCDTKRTIMTEQMMRFLRRLIKRGAEWKRATGSPALTPLTQLVDAAEPDADLLGRIEAAIDEEPPVAVRPVHHPARIRFAAVLALVASISGTVGFLLGPESQKIIAQPSASADWVPLGSVTLHGQALRAFVRGKCKGHSHFYITMHGVSTDETPGNPGKGTPLAENGEKILMECIF